MNRQILMLWVGMLVLILVACGSQPTAPADEPTAAVAEATVETTEPTVDEQVPTDEPAPTAAPTETADPAGGTTAQAGSLLQRVLNRGNLICGVNGGLPGFSNLEPDGTFRGFDADFCRAVAAAIFGDPEQVEFRPLSTQERFTALQTGEVDVLFRNTTWTLSRDTSAMDFGPTTFYDGQGIMVRADLGATSLSDLEGADICVQSGTTTELNLTDNFRAQGISFNPVVFEEIDPTYNAYSEGRCDAVTSDISQLVSRRTTFEDPGAHEILDIVLSKEPLAPVVAQGDSQWRDVVSWVVYTTIQAEEFGINSTNINDFLDTENPDIRRFLGIDGELGSGLGLPNDFTVTVIQSVGNYAEIFDRNLGPDTPFNLDRGQNATWQNGGLLYSPPFR